VEGGSTGDFLVFRDDVQRATVRSADGSGSYEDATGRKGSGS
jgi:hypothetical protein